jgi:predicted nuclease of restriction endonuclease-like (RecB) superfamily
MEPPCAGPPDQEPSARKERKSPDQFSACLATARLGYGRTGFKGPYNFDFLTVASAAKEREIERGLLAHLRDLLLELGRGFAFVGSQVPLEIGDEIFYLDLLFYHVRLHCYYAIS